MFGSSFFVIGTPTAVVVLYEMAWPGFVGVWGCIITTDLPLVVTLQGVWYRRQGGCRFSYYTKRYLDCFGGFSGDVSLLPLFSSVAAMERCIFFSDMIGSLFLSTKV